MPEEMHARAGPGDAGSGEVDIAPVLRQLRVPLHSCGRGWRLTDNPRIYIEGGRWLETEKGSGRVLSQGGLVQLLVIHFDMRPEEAQQLVSGSSGGERMLPQDRLGLARRRAHLQQMLQLFTGGEKLEGRVQLPGQDSRWEKALQKYLQEDLGLDGALSLELRYGGFVYAGRGIAVFPGRSEKGVPGWYYLKSLRGENPGRAGGGGHLFPACLWMWGKKDAAALHVFDTPPEALRHLACTRAEGKTSKQKAAWMALTGGNNPAALFSCLLRLPRICEIVLHLQDGGCAGAIQAELEAAAGKPLVCREEKWPGAVSPEEKKGGEDFDGERSSGSYPQPPGSVS